MRTQFAFLFIDINECLGYEDTSVFDVPSEEFAETGRLCHANALCYNTIGSFACKCKNGYSGDGGVCVSKSSIIAKALYRSRSYQMSFVCCCM